MSVDMREIEFLPQEIAAMLKADVRDVVTKIAMDLWRVVTFISPVDTGRYRAAWALSAQVPTEFVPAAADFPAGQVQSAPGMPAFKLTNPWPIAYLQNNLPYAAVLEDGSSGQAPAGVLGVAMVWVDQQIKFGV